MISWFLRTRSVKVRRGPGGGRVEGFGRLDLEVESERWSCGRIREELFLHCEEGSCKEGGKILTLVSRQHIHFVELVGQEHLPRPIAAAETMEENEGRRRGGGIHTAHTTSRAHHFRRPELLPQKLLTVVPACSHEL